MDRIFAISDTVNTAVHALALAAASGGSISASKAAKELDVSPSYFAKILQKNEILKKLKIISLA